MSNTSTRWHAPSPAASSSGVKRSGLKLYNSLSDSLVDFTPEDPHRVKVYICGPTVYDSSHMGHARTYLSFDLLRRVMENYFGYNIFMVMNITDVDDKIILKARRNHLLKQFFASPPPASDVLDRVRHGILSATTKLQSKLEKLTDEKARAAAAAAAGSKSASKQVNEHEEAIGNTAYLLNLVQDNRKGIEAAAQQWRDGAQTDSQFIKVLESSGGDVLAELLDAEQGSQVRDTSIFRAHAARYEAEFLEDMARLGCLMPDVLTRVSEFIQPIIVYIQRIIARGLAYESNGSVYFCTKDFSKTHCYAKCSPSSVGNEALLEDGEGALSEGSEKRDKSDFALWKASKAGEPEWDSPWGKGRPGWHIECSVMASELLGSTLDVHGGGVDLKFPHHDNEMAQSEAYWDHHQWVHYFLHTGHLHIEGRKMSKSLKNFLTIREVLEQVTPRQLRLLFLMQSWRDPMNYSQGTLAEMLAKEKTIREFMLMVKTRLRDDMASQHTAGQRWNKDDEEVHKAIMETEKKVHTALCEDVNTPLVLKCLEALILTCNKYIMATTVRQASLAKAATAAASDEFPEWEIATFKELGPQKPKLLLLKRAAGVLTKVFHLFGIDEGSEFPFVAQAGGQGSEEALKAPMEHITLLREKARELARSKAAPEAFVSLCTHVNQEVMPSLEALAAAAPAQAVSPGQLVQVLRQFVREVGEKSQQGPQQVLVACDALRDDVLPPLGIRLEDQQGAPAIWKLEDPAALQQERRAKEAAAAAAAIDKLKKQIEQWSDRSVPPRLFFEKQVGAAAASSSAPLTLVQGYSSFDDAGMPTLAKDGKPLDTGAKKGLEKTFAARSKEHKLFVDKAEKSPSFLDDLKRELAEIQSKAQ